MDENFPLKSQLREDLVQTAHSRNGRARRVRLTAITVGLAAVLLMGVTGVTAVVKDSPATASALSIVDNGPSVTVRLKDLQAQPQEIIDELESKRVNVLAETVKVAPSSVGRFVTLQAGSADFSPLDGGGNAFTTFRVAKNTPQPVTVGVGVPAAPGDAYGAFADAYLPGNPLHCSGLWGKRTSDIVAFVQQRDLQATYRAPDANGSLTNVLPELVNNYYVTDVVTSATNQITVTLNTEPRSPFVQSNTSGPVDCQ